MTSFAKRAFDYAPTSDPLEILYRDAHYLIVNKPAGLLSVRGKAEHLQDCLETRVQAQWPDARIVHRLDMSTSGLLVMAMNADAHRHIGLQFERRHVSKSYVAKVWGNVQGNTGHINLPLICDWPNRPLQMVDFETGKPARTDWEVIGRGDISTDLRLHPITGRSHQLRVHLLSIGHVILGDRLYAKSDAFMAADRLMLHAETLNFRHPDGGEHMSYTAPAPF